MLTDEESRNALRKAEIRQLAARDRGQRTRQGSERGQRPRGAARARCAPLQRPRGTSATRRSPHRPSALLVGPGRRTGGGCARVGAARPPKCQL